MKPNETAGAIQLPDFPAPTSPTLANGQTSRTRIDPDLLRIRIGSVRNRSMGVFMATFLPMLFLFGLIPALFLGGIAFCIAYGIHYNRAMRELTAQA